MGCSLVVALLVGTAGLAAARSVLDGHKASIASAPKAPVWPDAYEVAYTIELPYIASVQPTPLRYPVHVWYDGRSQLLRTSFYEGLDETYLTPDATYEVYPRVTTRTCLVYNHTVGPTLRGSNDILAPLPDIGPDWQYGGSFQVKSHATHMWQLTYRVDEKVSTYTFHVAQADGRPLQLHMVGVNLLTGSHYDQYEVDFTLFEPRANAASFAPPSLCKQHDEDPQAPPHHAVLQQAASLLLSAWVPAGVSGRITPQQLQQQQEGSGLLGALHGLWSRVVGATSETASTVLDNLRFIHEWNRARAERVRAEAQSVSLVSAAGQQHRLGSPAGGAGAQPGRPASPVAAVDLFKMEANKFVSWGEDKFASTMLGRAPRSEDYKQRRRSLSSSAHLGQYQRRLRDEELPQSVDWRGSPADGPVKDQASCGSCWTFATTGAMRGQWFTATGQALSFSEQQIVDCSWNYEVNGCWGGDTEPAMEYIRDAGGAVLEADYPYLGQNSYCKDTKHRKAARFSGYQSIPKHDEKALMEAVHLHGPLSIAFDAGDRSFRYYSEGVYYRESCGTKVRDLNHAVTLVGYGTTWNGTDYWLLRNSWSVAWGSDGYFKLARKGNDCGVTTDAVLAVVDEDAAAQARRIAAAAA